MIYKKGQIVPRRFVRCKNRRTQFLFVFGCDVSISGRTIAQLGSGSIFVMRDHYIGGKNGKPRLYACPSISDVTLIGKEIGTEPAIRIPS